MLPLQSDDLPVPSREEENREKFWDSYKVDAAQRYQNSALDGWPLARNLGIKLPVPYPELGRKTYSPLELAR